jgi:hypothetical protein
MIDKFLGGNGLSEAKSEFWITEETDEQDVSDETLDEIIAFTEAMPEIRKEKWTIIVFSETFFSDDSLDNSELEKIMKFCRLLTEKHENLVISVNFLHKYRGQSNTPSRRTPINEDFVATANEVTLRRNRPSDLRFSNCSLIVWNGVPISSYRKTTYCKEGEDQTAETDIVREGYGYDFGDWKSYSTPELADASDDHKKIAELFNSGRKQIIVSRTCSDINFTPKLSSSVKLLILTADDAPGVEWWTDKVRNTNVCVSDATRGCSISISGTRNEAERILVSHFIFENLSCILAVFYGDCDEEIVDSGCCGGCCF